MFLLLLSLFAGCVDDYPATASQIQTVIDKELSSLDFNKRESGSRKLSRYGYFALPILEKNFDHADPEVAKRCRNIYDEYFSIVEDPISPSLWNATDGLTVREYYNKIGMIAGYDPLVEATIMNGFIRDNLNQGVPRSIMKLWVKDVSANQNNGSVRWNQRPIAIPRLDFEAAVSKTVDEVADHTLLSMLIIDKYRKFRKFSRELLIGE